MTQQRKVIGIGAAVGLEATLYLAVQILPCETHPRCCRWVKGRT